MQTNTTDDSGRCGSACNDVLGPAKDNRMRPEYWEVVEALLGMACQYLEDADGKLDEGCFSASEGAVDVLTRLGLVQEGALLDDAFNHEWLREKFPGA